MYATALLAVALGSVAVNAVIGDIGVPATIKSGETFNILAHQTIGQGYGEYSIIFGVQSVDPAVGVPYDDALGDVFAGPYDLRGKHYHPHHPYHLVSVTRDEVHCDLRLIQDPALGSNYNLNIPNVKLSGKQGPAVVRAAVLGLAGVYKQMSLSTFSINTTIGTSTSTEYVYTDTYHRGASCTWAK